MIRPERPPQPAPRPAPARTYAPPPEPPEPYRPASRPTRAAPRAQAGLPPWAFALIGCAGCLCFLSCIVLIRSLTGAHSVANQPSLPDLAPAPPPAPGAGSTLSTAQIVSLCLVAFVTWTNSRGLKYGKGTQNVFTTMKIGTLIGVILVGCLLGWNAAAVEGNFGQLLGLSNDWIYQAIKQVGNYGESYERTVGMGSPLKLARGKNELWTKGGLLYTPPFQ